MSAFLSRYTPIKIIRKIACQEFSEDARERKIKAKSRAMDAKRLTLKKIIYAEMRVNEAYNDGKG